MKSTLSYNKVYKLAMCDAIALTRVKWVIGRFNKKCGSSLGRITIHEGSLPWEMRVISQTLPDFRCSFNLRSKTASWLLISSPSEHFVDLLCASITRPSMLTTEINSYIKSYIYIRCKLTKATGSSSRLQCKRGSGESLRRAKMTSEQGFPYDCAMVLFVLALKYQ